MRHRKIQIALLLIFLCYGTTSLRAQALDVVNSASDTLLRVQENGKVGIGDTSPTHTLDVAGKIGINDTQILYLPDQTNFIGSLILGNGGGSLSHTTGTTGRFNTAVGIIALNSITTGAGNTAFGQQALYSNTTGLSNTASGASALFANSTGNYNTACGHAALGNNSTSSGNVGLGYYANYYNQAGSFNTTIGYQAGRGPSLHSKSSNVFIGAWAGYSETGSNKLYIENSTSSAPLIGGDFSTNRVGINTNSPGTAFAVVGLTGTSSFNYVKVNTATGDFYYATSSKRYKEDIQELDDDFSKILKVEPRSYLDKTSRQREIGYIAEDFDDKGLQDLVIYNENNQPNGLKYDRISLYLVEVVKKQQEQIAELQSQIRELQK